jgi:hypothetical protein
MAKMPLAEHDNVVKTFPPDRADRPLKTLPTKSAVSAAADRAEARSKKRTTNWSRLWGREVKKNQPRLLFLHFWAVDDSTKLAKGLRAALDKTASAKNWSLVVMREGPGTRSH